MPYNFNSQQEYNFNMKDLIRYYKIPDRYTEQIIVNYNLVSERDHKHILELVNIQRDVKQIFDIFIPTESFSPNSKKHISFSFNVDKILNFLEVNPICTQKVNINILSSNINTNLKLSLNQFNTKPIITSSLFDPHTPTKPFRFTIDGNHRVTYCKQNNINELRCINIDYEILKILNPFDSYSEYYLYVLFYEIQNFYKSSWFEKKFRPKNFFRICSSDQPQFLIDSI